jgi:hypothetical protein
VDIKALLQVKAQSQYFSKLHTVELGKSSVSPQGGFEPFCSSVFEAAGATARRRAATAATMPRQPTLVRVVEDSCCFVFPTHARAQLSHSRRHLKTDYYNGKSRKIERKKSKKYKKHHVFQLSS